MDPSGPDPIDYFYGNYSLQTADGAKHPLGNQGMATEVINANDIYYLDSGPWRSLDATGWKVNGAFQSIANPNQTLSPSSVVDADGITYESASAAEEDPNGNQITLSGTTLTDSVGRQISLPPTAASSSNTSTAVCPQTLLPVAFAVLWTPPTVSGLTSNYTFCYATIAVNIAPGIMTETIQQPGNTGAETRLQSIVLPNGQS